MKLMQVLECCLHHDPSVRFDAPSLCYVLDEIMNGTSGLGDGEGSDVKWSDESWELP